MIEDDREMYKVCDTCIHNKVCSKTVEIIGIPKYYRWISSGRKEFTCDCYRKEEQK